MNYISEDPLYAYRYVIVDPSCDNNGNPVCDDWEYCKDVQFDGYPTVKTFRKKAADLTEDDRNICKSIYIERFVVKVSYFCPEQAEMIDEMFFIGENLSNDFAGRAKNEKLAISFSDSFSLKKLI